MKKKTINKPRFGRIFAVRFLISLIICSLIANYVLYELDNYVWKKADSECTLLRKSITELAASMIYKIPDSEEYKQDLNQLKQYIATYQSYDHCYIEVHVHDQRITLDDTAYFILGEVYKDENNPEEPIIHDNAYFIESISYLDPLNEYMDGLLDERKQNETYRKWARDPIFDSLDHVGNYDRFRSYKMKSFYVNRETHTFIPGTIIAEYMGNEYEIDCTPENTKGYPKLEIDSGKTDFSIYLNILYRESPKLSSTDFLYVIVPDITLETDEIEYDQYADYLRNGKMYEYSWYVGYSQPYYSLPPVITLAPVSSAIIIVAAILTTTIAALIVSVIKYQKEKTVWNIFEYRTKTTEAMAHDLKTPLSSMMFYLEDLEDSSEDPEKVREYAKALNDKVVGMDHMIADILQFSRSESGKVDLNKEKVSLKELVFDSLKEFPEMKTEIRGEDISLTTDRKILAQVIVNLLSNCDRYGRKGAVVDIEIAPESVTISNKTDRTYEDADSLKKPFVKGDNSRGNKGTGLGLAIADNDLSILGYKLELSSEADEFKAKVKFR